MNQLDEELYLKAVQDIDTYVQFLDSNEGQVLADQYTLSYGGNE